MSEVKVDTISERTAANGVAVDGVTIKDSGLTIPSGGTLTVASGGTIDASAGTATGFAGGLASVQTFTSSGTWTRPAGITKVIMEVQGCGGSGAGSGSGGYSTGGGGGGYAKKLLDVSSISSSTITIGTAGSGGTTGNPGTAGGDCVWADGTNTITGSGGAGGQYHINARSGGAGGAATGGDINLPGGDAPCDVDNQYIGQIGGGAFLGQRGGGEKGGGGPGKDYGGGGGSGCKQESQTGGDAGAGIVIVWEYK